MFFLEPTFHFDTCVVVPIRLSTHMREYRVA